MRSPDVLIVGGGVIGCTLARELALAGLGVLLLERGRVGMGASTAAAGMLVPVPPPDAPPQLALLCRQAADGYEAWLARLRAEGADDVGYRRVGWLEVALDERQAEGLRRRNASPTGGAQWLSADELRREEPGLGPQAAGALFHPDDAQVTPALLLRQLARLAVRAGVEVHEEEAVRELTRHGDTVTGVHTDRASYHPGLVVLTAGAWTGSLARLAGSPLAVLPVKGQLLRADCYEPPVRRAVSAEGTLLVPRPDGSLLLGVTEEEAGFDTRVRLAGLRQVLARCAALVPAVDGLPLADAWAGLRPATPDGLPSLGPLPPWHNLWVSTGHFRKGVLLAPLSAQLLARSLLAGRLDAALEPCSPARPTAGD